MIVYYYVEKVFKNGTYQIYQTKTALDVMKEELRCNETSEHFCGAIHDLPPKWGIKLNHRIIS